MNKVRIFIDMDGTIADLHAIPDWYERAKTEEDFFQKLEPFQNLITALFLIKQHYGDQIETKTLSAVDKTTEFTTRSKSVWIDTNAAFIEEDDRIFSPLGENKAKYVGPISKRDLLLDDYTKNLLEWTASGGSAIKIRNNINCNGNKWKGEIIYNQDSLSVIVSKLDAIIRDLM